MKTSDHRKERKGDLHFLNADAMVACNPRDREAAHRAEVEGIATEDPRAVTCRKCRALIPKATDREGRRTPRSGSSKSAQDAPDAAELQSKLPPPP